MCRSSQEPNGPSRCPSHARQQLAVSIAAVEDLELQEAQLYRAACLAAAEQTQRRHVAGSALKAAENELDELRSFAGDDGDVEEWPEHQQAEREVRAAYRSVRAAAGPARQALAVVDRRREQAHTALRARGVPGATAEELLDELERDTGLAPPF